MSRATSTRSVEQLLETRDILRGEIGSLEREIIALNQEIERCTQDKSRIRILLTSIEASLAEAGVLPDAK